MEINVDDYSHYKKKIIDLYNREGLNRAIELASSSGIPLIVTYTFLQEEFGGFEDLIQVVNEFYNYDIKGEK